MNRAEQTPSARIASALPTAVVVAIALWSLTAPSGSVAAKRPASLYWGAQVGSQLTGTAAPWDMRAVSKFQSIVGKGLSLVEFSSPFVECRSTCVFTRFPATPFEEVRRYGAIPVFGWSSQSIPSSLNEPDFQLSDVIEGRYDSYIREFADKAKAWGHPFFLRFDWEMNGSWFPWSEGVNGNNPGEFVAAWRHVHDIFTSVGATNATWVWCPNVDIFGELRNLRSLYPGDRYVDWTCLDGFNWGNRRGSPGWLSFNRVYHSTYKQIVTAIAPDKPMLIAEIASSDRGGSKANWIKDMLQTVRTRYRKVRGLVWYDVNDRGTHWPIETSRSASNAFRAGIRSAAYRSNLYAGLGAGPIPPP
jgi:Glycosyl hydrolase family 26